MILIVCFYSLLMFSQGVTQFGTLTNQEAFSKGEYVELENPTPTDMKAWESVKKTYVVCA